MRLICNFCSGNAFGENRPGGSSLGPDSRRCDNTKYSDETIEREKNWVREAASFGVLYQLRQSLESMARRQSGKENQCKAVRSSIESRLKLQKIFDQYAAPTHYELCAKLTAAEQHPGTLPKEEYFVEASVWRRGVILTVSVKSKSFECFVTDHDGC